MLVSKNFLSRLINGICVFSCFISSAQIQPAVASNTTLYGAMKASSIQRLLHRFGQNDGGSCRETVSWSLALILCSAECSNWVPCSYRLP